MVYEFTQSKVKIYILYLIVQLIFFFDVHFVSKCLNCVYSQPLPHVKVLRKPTYGKSIIKSTVPVFVIESALKLFIIIIIIFFFLAERDFKEQGDQKNYLSAQRL